ncbi:MAG: AAA family ATPase [Chlamydiae bacterium]|nr:AAA family ATPase [Chlamydiota bacterium]
MAEHLNEYFEKMGYALRVDCNGIVSQKHLGPHRMRGEVFDLLEAQDERIKDNLIQSKNPEKILEALTKNKSTFTHDEAQGFMNKYLSGEEGKQTSGAFWKLPQLVQLIDKKTGKAIDVFTSQKAIEEEKEILQRADRIQSKKPLFVEQEALKTPASDEIVEEVDPYIEKYQAPIKITESHKKLKDPAKILDAITKNKSVFTRDEAINFIYGCIKDVKKAQDVSEAFWKLPQLVQLMDKETAKAADAFTSQKVIDEEKKVLRLADNIRDKNPLSIKTEALQDSISAGLTPEQKQAYHAILKENRMSILQGYAGTGKSYLLQSLQKTYEKSGYTVRALGPDSATVKALEAKGLSHTENAYRFLFGIRYNKRDIRKGKEVWMVDEVGKFGNRPLLELLKEADKRDVKLILSGDSAQLSPVERGGFFRVFCERYPAHVLSDIQRQKHEEHRKMAKSLAIGKFGAALDRLAALHGIRWEDSKKHSMEALVENWVLDSEKSPNQSSIIIATSNKEVRILNEVIRAFRKERGELGDKEFYCTTSLGDCYLSEGDRIEFRKNDNSLGVTNGLTGVLVKAEERRFTVEVENEGEKQIVKFNPKQYHSYQPGYASSFYRSQGQTVDKAYVLHSPATCREMFYVGLTRHARNVEYFVSKEQSSGMADLKLKALRSSQKELTVDYTSAMEMSLARLTEERKVKIDSLQNSSSILDKVKGFGYSTWDHISGKIQERKDRAPSSEFYYFREEKTGAFRATLVNENLGEKEFSVKEMLQNAVGKAKSVKVVKEKNQNFQEVVKNTLVNTDVLSKKSNAEIVLVIGKSINSNIEEMLSKQGKLCVGFVGDEKDIKSQDWAVFSGRKVVLWPENTKEGFEISGKICHELRKMGMGELRELESKEMFKIFPANWSLEHKLPENVKEQNLQKLLTSSLHKGINLSQFSIWLSVNKNDYASKARINELLWRIDERMRPGLEKKHEGQHWKIHEVILHETSKIIHSSQERKDVLQKKSGLQGLALERLSFQVSAFEAEHGRGPRTGELQTLKKVIQKCGHVPLQKGQNPEIANYTIDRLLLHASSKALRGEKIESSLVHEFKKDFQLSEVKINQSIALDIQNTEMARQKTVSLER